MCWCKGYAGLLGATLVDVLCKGYSGPLWATLVDVLCSLGCSELRWDHSGECAEVASLLKSKVLKI